MCQMPLKGESFPKEARVKKRFEFRNLARKARRFHGQGVVIEYLRIEGQAATRLGVTVTKRYGKAHERNLFKRRVREVFRKKRASLPFGYDLNVRPRKNESPLSYSIIEQDFSDLNL